MTTPRPWLWILAGANGAGKTTLAKRLFPGTPFVNADELARELSPEHPERAAVAAGRLTLTELRRLLGSGQELIWESTLSGHVHQRVIELARARGFRIGMIYVGLADAGLASARIADRVSKGGHDVAPAEVERRYRRSLANFRSVARMVDIAYVPGPAAPGFAASCGSSEAW